MTQQQTLLTAEEFFRLYGGKDDHYELVEGKVVETAIPGMQHGGVVATVGSVLLKYVSGHKLGQVCARGGFILSPGTVRAPDVAFIRKERIPAEGLPQAFFSGPPDLAVEVVSPSDTAAELDVKVHEYLRNGVSQVWVAYPEGKRMQVFERDGRMMRHEEGDTLNGGDLLPGFAVVVGELFKT